MRKKLESWTVIDNSEKINRMTPEALLKATTKIGIKWQEISTGIVTEKNIIDTGALRQSLTYKATENAVKVGSPLKYAKEVELGTSRMRARPYIVPAIKDHAEIYNEIVVDEFKKMSKKI